MMSALCFEATELCDACMAGKTLAENLESVPDLQQGQQVIMPIDKPIKETGHLQVPFTPIN